LALAACESRPAAARLKGIAIYRANFLVTINFLHKRDTYSGQEAITADQLAGASYPARRTGRSRTVCLSLSHKAM